jgi:hypothetical protein
MRRDGFSLGRRLVVWRAGASEHCASLPVPHPPATPSIVCVERFGTALSRRVATRAYSGRGIRDSEDRAWLGLRRNSRQRRPPKPRPTPGYPRSIAADAQRQVFIGTSVGGVESRGFGTLRFAPCSSSTSHAFDCWWNGSGWRCPDGSRLGLIVDAEFATAKIARGWG